MEEIREQAIPLPGPGSQPVLEEVREGDPPRAGSSCLVELIVDMDFDAFEAESQTRILITLQQFLHRECAIEVKQKECGSVKLIVELTREQAEGLLQAIQKGVLNKFRIVAGRILDSSSPPDLGSNAEPPPSSAPPSADSPPA